MRHNITFGIFYSFLYKKMASRLTSLLLYVLTISARSSANDAERKQMGGDLAKLAQFPYVVYVKLPSEKNGGDIGCTGSILNADWVVTTAHCLKINETKDKYVATVLAGTVDFRKTGPDTQVRKSVHVIVNEPENVTESRDIALINVEESFTINEYVHPIEIATTKPILSYMQNPKCMSVGFGAWKDTDLAKNMNAKLYYMKSAIVTCTGVIQKYRQSYEIYDEHVCANGGKPGLTTCGGDLGGPIVCRGKIVGVLQGRISLSKSIKPVCGVDNGTKLMYVPLIQHENWIRKYVKQTIYVKRDVKTSSGSVNVSVCVCVCVLTLGHIWGA